VKAAVCNAHGVKELWSADWDFRVFLTLQSETLWFRSNMCGSGSGIMQENDEKVVISDE